MNLLDELHYSSFDDFSILVLSIDSGWMDIVLSSSESCCRYKAGHLTAPLNDLLYALAGLLTSTSAYEENSLRNREFAFVYHDLEGRHLGWLFAYEEGVLRLLIHDSPGFDLVKELIHCRFDGVTYKYSEYEEIPNLNEDLLFAMQGPPALFVKMLLELVVEIEAKNPEDATDGEWGFSHNKESYGVLEDWLLRQSA